MLRARDRRRISGDARNSVSDQQGLDLVLEPTRVAALKDQLAVEPGSNQIEKSRGIVRLVRRTGRQLNENRTEFVAERRRLREKPVQCDFDIREAQLVRDFLRKLNAEFEVCRHARCPTRICLWLMRTIKR